MARLAVHYYRHNFTESQAKSLISDLVDDLTEFSVFEVEQAIREYRQDAAQKYFPTSGQLRKIIGANKKHAADIASKRPCIPEFGESRPSFWWLLPIWKYHWREDEIPEHSKEAYAAIRAKGLREHRRESPEGLS